MKIARRASVPRVAGLILLLLAGIAFTAVFLFRPGGFSRDDPPPADIGRQVHDLCAACHAYPPPDSFPRSA